MSALVTFDSYQETVSNFLQKKKKQKQKQKQNKTKQIKTKQLLIVSTLSENKKQWSIFYRI